MINSAVIFIIFPFISYDYIMCELTQSDNALKVLILKINMRNSHCLARSHPSSVGTRKKLVSPMAPVDIALLPKLSLIPRL